MKLRKFKNKISGIISNHKADLNSCSIYCNVRESTPSGCLCIMVIDFSLKWTVFPLVRLNGRTMAPSDS